MFLTNGGGLGEDILSVKAEKAGENNKIPEQAIRLRILANSDSTQDQQLKRKVRDAVIQEVEHWADKPETLKEARQMIRSHLPRLESIAKQTVKEKGFQYPVNVEFGPVSFPTKLYGDQVYPAGEYEAVLITLGQGKGDNWWCVLFPPLCFVDMSNGDAVSARTAVADRAMAAPAQMDSSSDVEEKDVEIRFFFFDSVKSFFSGLFGLED
ncbi:stage II sporulation protein R [Melghirimyces algeriensis]